MAAGQLPGIIFNGSPPSNQVAVYTVVCESLAPKRQLWCEETRST